MAAIAIFAVSGALAQSWFNPDPCADNYCAGLQLGEVNGTSPAPTYRDGKIRDIDCPAEIALCQTSSFLYAGRQIIVDGRKGDFVHVRYWDGTGQNGYIRADRFTADTIQPTTKPSLDAWLGHWGTPSSEITITESGGVLAASGQGYWPGKDYVQEPGMPSRHEGSFEATAKPDGYKALFQEDLEEYTCKVSALLFGPFLLLKDNAGCGGMNVRFGDLYTRTP